MATATMDKTDKQGLEELRRRYRRLRKNAAYSADLAVWDREVGVRAARLARKAGLPTIPPALWVEAAESTTVECEQCHGSGIFGWGAVVNGKVTHSGPCFRCAGAGRQGQSDFVRNRVYDGHRKVL
jgi:hypothetical protein